MFKETVQKAISAAVSALVVLVMVGAAKIVWDGATTVQEKVNDATNDLRSLVTVLQDEILKLKAKDNELAESIIKVKDIQQPKEGFTETSPLPLPPIPLAPESSSEIVSLIEGEYSEETIVPEEIIQQPVAAIEQLPERNFLQEKIKKEKMKW